MKQPKPTLKGQPGGILWLMGHELRLYWRRGRMKPRSGLIVAAILLGVWSLITWTVFHRFGAFIPPPPFTDGAGAGFALMAVSIIIVFMASVMTSGAILGAVDAIYTRNDLDLLLSSPLSPWRVLIVRASAIAIGALPVYAGFLGPPLVWLTLYSSPFWLTSLVFLLTLAFVATGLALLIVTGLFRLIGPRNTRVLAQIVSALTGGAIFILFQWFNLSFSHNSNFQDQAEVFRMIETMNIDPQAWWLLPARAMTGDVPSTIIWVLLTAILFPVGVYVFSRSFVSDAAAASAMGRKSRAIDGRIAAVRGGVMRSVIRKELRLLIRDPLLLSQIGLQLVYIFPLALVLIRPGSDFRMTEAAFAPALTLLSSTLAGSLIWITASAEDAPDLVASAPASASLIDRAKLLSAIVPVIALMTIPLIALLVRDAWAGAWATGGVIAGATSAALIGLWRRNPGSRRDFVRRRQGGSTLTALGKAFIGMSLAATAGAGAYGFPWLAIIPAIIGLAILGALYKPTPKFAVEA